MNRRRFIKLLALTVGGVRLVPYESLLPEHLVFIEIVPIVPEVLKAHVVPIW